MDDNVEKYYSLIALSVVLYIINRSQNNPNAQPHPPPPPILILQQQQYYYY